MSRKRLQAVGRSSRLPRKPRYRERRADTLVPHTAIRRRVAEHMVRSLSEAPHITTLFEADLEPRAEASRPACQEL